MFPYRDFVVLVGGGGGGGGGGDFLREKTRIVGICIEFPREPSVNDSDESLPNHPIFAYDKMAYKQRCSNKDSCSISIFQNIKAGQIDFGVPI